MTDGNDVAEQPRATATITSSPSQATPLTALATLAIAVAVSPVVVGMVGLVGDSWFPVGDFASALFRVSQVGSWETPLIGQESVKGWAHPGPWVFWLSAPLYRLTGGDPRSLLWTAGILNTGALAGVGLVAWRRGRWPLLIWSMVLVGVLVHNLEPERLVNIWVPFLPFCSFLLALFFAWDVALGNRRSILGFVLTAGFAASTHFSYATLAGLVVVWLVGWSLLWPRLLYVPATDAEWTEGRGPPRPPWSLWWTSIRRAGWVFAGLGVGPLLDLFFDTNNAARILTSVLTPPETVGLGDALSIVGRSVRPDGPWIGGGQPVVDNSVQGSGPLPLLLAVVALGICAVVARHKQLVDAAALATLTLILVVGSVPATSQIFLPVYEYLVQFQKIVGALTWFTVVWTGWRVVEPALRSERAQRVVGGLGGAAIVAVAAWSWGDAAAVDPPHPRTGAVVQDLRHQLAVVLPKDKQIRVEYEGDPFNTYGPGVIYWLIADGFDITTSDGGHGLKWGHEHRWQQGEDYDLVLTVALDVGHGFDAYGQCVGDGNADLVASHDELRPEEREWLAEMALRAAGGEEFTAADQDRLDRLHDKNVRIGAFLSDRVCA